MALIKCPNCGADISDKAYRCPKCGFELSVAEKLPQDKDDAVVNQKGPAERNDTIILSKQTAIKAVGAIVAFLCILAGVAFFAYQKGSSSMESSTEEIVTKADNESAEKEYTSTAEIDEKQVAVTEEHTSEVLSSQITETETDDAIAQTEFSKATEAISDSIVEDQNITEGKKNALASAQTTLKYTAHSYEGLIDYLKYEKFTDEEAKYGADNCGADWKEMAVKCAQTTLKYTAHSYEGLIDYLKYEKFTDEEAKYGADNCGKKWN